MSEEEKKTIEYLELFIKTDINYCRLEKIDVTYILNLIEKQQKEIDEYKYIVYKMKTGKLTQTFINKGYVEQEFISKDKIREKIKELKNITIGASSGIYSAQIDVLEELLEEN